jgi:hypothetical protein
LRFNLLAGDPGSLATRPATGRLRYAYVNSWQSQGASAQGDGAGGWTNYVSGTNSYANAEVGATGGGRYTSTSSSTASNAPPTNSTQSGTFFPGTSLAPVPDEGSDAGTASVYGGLLSAAWTTFQAGYSAVGNFLSNPTVKSSLQTLGGALEIAVGTAVFTCASWTGVGAVFAGYLIVHGADQAAAGISGLILGTPQTTYTNKGLVALTGSQEMADSVELALSVIATAGASAFTQACFAAGTPLLTAGRGQADRAVPAGRPGAGAVGGSSGGRVGSEGGGGGVPEHRPHLPPARGRSGDPDDAGAPVLRVQ